MENLVKAEDFGIEKKQEKDLMGDLPQIKKEREILEKQYSEIIKLDLEDSESSKKARELRLLIRNNRTKGINVWHKNAKDFFLKGGQFVDAIKRKEVDVNQRMENKLLEIEEYAERKEAERKEKLNKKRIKEIEPYSDFVFIGVDFGELSDEDWTKTFNGAKLQYEAEQKQIEEERREQERIEKIQRLHNERKEQLINIWSFVENKENNFGEMTENKFNQVKVNAEKLKEEYDKEQEEIRKENERLKKEREKREEEEAKKKAEYESKLKKEREAREKLEREEKKRKEDELKAKAEKERLAKLPEKEKMNNWVNSFELPELDIENATEKLIKEKFEAFKKWSNNQVKNY